MQANVTDNWLAKTGQPTRMASLRSGCYSLIIHLKRKKTIRVGKLGKAVFPVGTYVYTGSAMKDLGARLKRHCRRKKKIHWHIDYLLTLPEALIKKIILYPAAPGQECQQNKSIAIYPGATVILKGFGASDCKSGCASHLFFFANSSCRNSLVTHEGATSLNHHSSEASSAGISIDHPTYQR